MCYGRMTLDLREAPREAPGPVYMDLCFLYED